MDSTKLIKQQISADLAAGKSRNEVRKKYKKKLNMDTKSFDNIYGRFIRRFDIEKYREKENKRLKNATKQTRETKANGDIDLNLRIPALDKNDEKKFRTPEAIIKEFGYDSNEFEMVNIKQGFWDTILDGSPEKLETLKVTLKPKQKSLTEQEMANIMQRRYDCLASKVPDTKIVQKNTNKGDQIGIWHMADLHYGRLCAEEFEGINWGPKEALEDVMFMTQQLVEKVNNSNITTLIVALTGDGLNIDNKSLSTTHGTPQYNNIRYEKTVEGYYNLVTDSLDYILNNTQVNIEFIHVIGNHDTETMGTIVMALRANYKNNNRISIESEYNPRKYRRFGKNLFMFSHGASEKTRLSSLPAIEARNEYGKTCFTYIFSEHLHHIKAIDEKGVTLFQSPSPAPPCAWTTESGFLGARRGSEFLLFDKEEGILSDEFLQVLHKGKPLTVKAL